MTAARSEKLVNYQKLVKKKVVWKKRNMLFCFFCWWIDSRANQAKPQPRKKPMVRSHLMVQGPFCSECTSSGELHVTMKPFLPIIPSYGQYKARVSSKKGKLPLLNWPLKKAEPTRQFYGTQHHMWILRSKGFSFSQQRYYQHLLIFCNTLVLLNCQFQV